jgi:excisionase family DNA binding protein
MVDSKYYSPAELADILNLDARTVRNLINNGDLHAVKVGSQWRIGEKDFENFIEENKNVDVDEG